jgi:hypothetical protein
MTIVNVTGDTGLVYQNLSRHPAELKELNLLTVELQYLVFGVRKSNKRQFVFGKVSCELLGVFGANDKNGYIPFSKSIKILAQLRHVRSAERSGKPPVEN